MLLKQVGYCAVTTRSPGSVQTAGACIGFQTTGSVTGAILAGSCWTAGLATLVEKKSRRMELAFYCLSRVGQLPSDHL